jgi:imidazoleglycerol-phosphate dehydratase
MREGTASLDYKGFRAYARVVLEGSGNAQIASGSGFLDHMLHAMAKTGSLDLLVKGEGGNFHRANALGLAMGRAFDGSLRDKRGLQRYACSSVPMDDSLCQLALDISGRAFLVFQGEFKGCRIGDLETDEIKAFLESFVDGAKITLNLRFQGNNDHHQAESIFKAFGLALREAVRQTDTSIPSTKGLI